MSHPQIVLRPQKGGTFLAGHPWVLDKSIVPPHPAPADGEVVDLLLPHGQWLARGIYNGKSRIRVRLYSWSPEVQLDRAFWRERLEYAIALRRQLGFDDPRGAARLVFSEGDRVSGLVVDRYADHVVVQPTALAIHQRLAEIVELLVELLEPRCVLLRPDPQSARAEGIDAEAACLWGEPATDYITVTEHGVTYRVWPAHGQKTGLYLDQRENRLAAARSMRGRRVLDVCCYVGAFSLTAASRGEAAETLGIDSSAWAIQQARQNAEDNGLTNVRFEVGDCFQRLAELVESGERFGAVILDPPRFAGSRRSIDQALRAYHRLNRLAVELLEPGGILVSCSCSGLVRPDDFQRMLGGVMQKTGRDLQVLEARGASPDHPVNLACPQTQYLKCFICRASGETRAR